MRAFLVILLALITGAGGWFLGTRYGALDSAPREYSDTNSNGARLADISSARTSKTIRSQGKFEPASGIIKIVAPPGERIAQLIDKQIGDVVNTDDVLLTLQSQILREKDLGLAEARRDDALKKAKYEREQGEYQLDSAKLALAEANANDEKIASEAKKIVLLERQLTAAQKLFSRLKNIQSNPATNDLINQTEIDKQQLMVEQLSLQIEQANLEIEMSQKSADRAKELAINNLKTIKYAVENANEAIPLQSLNAAAAMAKQALEMTQIKSPIDNATILDIIVREGDSVTNQPVMVLGDTSQMHCITEVNDLFLNLIDLEKHNNLRARITSNAMKKPLMGTVIAKGVMIGPPSLKDPNPFASVDRRTVKVTIRLDDSATAARFVNLQVEVEIEVEPGALQ